MASSKSIKTPIARLSFPCLFEKNDFSNKYDVALLFDKSVDLNPIKEIMKEACTDAWGKDSSKWPKKLKISGIKDGDLESYEGYAGCNYVSAKSTKPIKCVGQNLMPVDDGSEAYAGRLCLAKINAYTWDNAEGGKGVSLGVSLIQLGPEDGVRFSGGAGDSSTDDLESWGDGSDNPANYSQAPETAEADLF